MVALAVDSERRCPIGVNPAFTGVLGGIHLSNTSGESAGPKVTLLRVRFSEGSKGVRV